jgi:hypothetical protein
MDATRQRRSELGRHDVKEFDVLNSDETETVFPIQSNAMTDSTTLPPNDS